MQGKPLFLCRSRVLADPNLAIGPKSRQNCNPGTLESNPQYRPPHEVAAASSFQEIYLSLLVHLVAVSEVYPGPTRFGGSSGDALFPCVSCSLCETASATVAMGRRQCRLAGSGFPAGFALTGIERDHSSPRCAAAFLITETQFCREHRNQCGRVICRR